MVGSSWAWKVRRPTIMAAFSWVVVIGVGSACTVQAPVSLSRPVRIMWWQVRQWWNFAMRLAAAVLLAWSCSAIQVGRLPGWVGCGWWRAPGAWNRAGCVIFRPPLVGGCFCHEWHEF